MSLSCLVFVFVLSLPLLKFRLNLNLNQVFMGAHFVPFLALVVRLHAGRWGYGPDIAWAGFPVERGCWKARPLSLPCSVRCHPPGVARHHRGLGALSFQWQSAQWTYTPHFARFWTRFSLDATWTASSETFLTGPGAPRGPVGTPN